jgi:RNA ligase (TIGR02306 family)
MIYLILLKINLLDIFYDFDRMKTMNDKLATIQRIKNIRKHPNADSLSIGDVLGWQVIFNHEQNSYQNDDLIVYIGIDTIVPDKPEFAFLKDKHFRIKPIRLRGEPSNGIIFPTSILPMFKKAEGAATSVFEKYQEGEDVTTILDIKKYEKPVPAELSGIARGSFPGFLIITDEDNLRNYPDAIPEMFSRPFYITLKIDGSSGTYFVNGGEFGACSRRINLKENETNGFWKIAKRYDIENALKKAFPAADMAIQGEVYGEGIQKNPLGIKGIDFALFNLFDIKAHAFLGYDKLVQFSKTYGIPMVPLIISGLSFPYTLEELVKLANEQKYSNGNPAEGIVIRPIEPVNSQILNKSWSGKVLNENYHD